MNLSDDRRNPFLIAYSLVRRSGFLRTSLGRHLFKSAYFLYKRYIEDDLRDLLRSYPAIVGDGNVLDIGANIGYTAAVLARAAQAGRKIYAFEPEPFNFRLLQQTALQPEVAGKIVPMQMAVGAADGAIDLWINDRHHADHRVATEQFRSAHSDLAHQAQIKSAYLSSASTAFFRTIRDLSLSSKSTFKAMNWQSARA